MDPYLTTEECIVTLFGPISNYRRVHCLDPCLTTEDCIVPLFLVIDTAWMIDTSGGIIPNGTKSADELWYNGSTASPNLPTKLWYNGSITEDVRPWRRH